MQSQEVKVTENCRGRYRETHEVNKTDRVVWCRPLQDKHTLLYHRTDMVLQYSSSAIGFCSSTTVYSSSVVSILFL